jgi:hypothetical protein
MGDLSIGHRQDAQAMEDEGKRSAGGDCNFMSYCQFLPVGSKGCS